jgi:hypothetical protein
LFIELSCFLFLAFSLTWIFRPFDYFILLTIAANCVVLSMDAPHPAGDSTDLNRQLVSVLLTRRTVRSPYHHHHWFHHHYFPAPSSSHHHHCNLHHYHHTITTVSSPVVKILPGKFSIFSGSQRDLFCRYIQFRGSRQNLSNGIYTPPWSLSAKWLEHFRFHRSHCWVCTLMRHS